MVGVTELRSDEEPAPSTGFQRVIQRAAIHVQSSGRSEVTGANVLVAIFNERESTAAKLLGDEDVSRYDAVNYLAHGVSKIRTQDTEVPPPPRSVPEQKETAFRFERQNGYPIGYRRIRPNPERLDRAKQEQVCGFLRDELSEFVAMCPEHSNALQHIRTKVEKYRSLLDADYLDLDVLRLWKAGNDLRVELRKDRKRQKDSDPDTNPLDVEFSERLAGIVALHNMLSVGDPELSTFDNATVDPADRKRLESSVSDLKEFVNVLDSSPSIVEREVPSDFADLISEGLEDAASADRSLQIADNSANNLTREILREALIEANTAKSEKSTLKSIREGAERAVGASAVAGTLGAGGITFSYFVKANEVLLQNLVTGWFGQGHVLHQVIQWIAKFCPF